MIQKKVNNPYENYVTLTAVFVVVAQSIISITNTFLRSIIQLPYKLDTILIYILFGVIVFLGISRLINRLINNKFVIIVVVTIVISSLITILFKSSATIFLLNVHFKFLILTLPWIIVSSGLRDYYQFYKYLYFSSFIILISFFLIYLINPQNIFQEYSYNQDHAYLLLVPAIVFIDSSYYEKKFSSFIFLFITAITLVLIGARGPVLSLILFFLIILIVNIKKGNPILFFLSITTFFILVLIIMNSFGIVNHLIEFARKNGLSSRVLERIIEGNFLIDKTRVELYSIGINIMFSNPLLGTGIGYERILIWRNIGSINNISDAIGWYPHNIFLEIFLHYGILIGLSLIFLFFYSLNSIYRNKINKIEKRVLLIFIGIGFIPFLFSGSYIESSNFFFLLGLIIYQYNTSSLTKRNLN